MQAEHKNPAGLLLSGKTERLSSNMLEKLKNDRSKGGSRTAPTNIGG